ncbi:winged helix-turn-helix domain-containing protein [Sphingopyxis sp. R3-92]|uniref:winged helix-turn-helix domain-containing protein n=1 Tax=Sphingopyxis sp. R3-92 TaxID=3158553 RepID=UPI003EE7B81D
MAEPVLKLKVQLLCGDEIAMGPGKADLLDAIHTHGSISAAGRALGMSYRRSWLLVDAMNRCWTERLVETIAGGGKERGARVTDAGQKILAAYREIQRSALQSVHGDAYRELGRKVREVPLAPDAARSS